MVSLAALTFVTNCSREVTNLPKRLAILPANVLIADPSSQWMSVAVPVALYQDLVTSRTLLAAAAGNTSAAYQFGASAVLRTTVENRNGRISIEAALADTATQQNQQIIRVDGPSAEGLLQPLNALAKRLDEHASRFPSKSDRALELFASAAQTANPETRIRTLNDAIAADPAFGSAYIALTETLLQTRQDPAPVLTKGTSHRNEFAPLDQARFKALAAQISQAPIPEQEKATREVLNLAPNDVDALASLSSFSFLRGDGAAGERLLSRALEISLGNQNLRHQLALGLLETRRFSDAEKIFTGLDNNPGILPELAVCILLEGDIHRADTVFDRYLKLQSNAQIASLLHAAWLAISGRTANAIDLLDKINTADPASRVVALSQLAILRLLSRDAAGARNSATLASQLAGQSNAFGTTVLLLTNGDAPARQWKESVDSSGLAGQPKQALLGYGLFLNGRYAEAAQVWQEALQRSGGADLRARTMMAASLDRSGRAGDAAKVLVQPFLPELGDLYAPVSFSEMRRLLKLDTH